MIYRCRNCDCNYEEARGVLPSASCGLYFVFLSFLLFGCLTLVILGLHFLVGPLTEPAERAPIPWWAWIVIFPISLVMSVLGLVALHHVLAFAEWLVYARRKCPSCGSRKWSRGFTRGFGL